MDIYKSLIGKTLKQARKILKTSSKKWEILVLHNHDEIPVIFRAGRIILYVKKELIDGKEVFLVEEAK